MLWEAAREEGDREVGPPGAEGPWHPVWGDRCQQIAWVGIHMDELRLRAMLDRWAPAHVRRLVGLEVCRATARTWQLPGS